MFRNGFSYMYPDPYENHFKQAEGDLFWKSPLSPSLLIKSRIWRSIRKIYKSLPNEITQGKKFLPYLVYGSMLHRGEKPVAFRGKNFLFDIVSVYQIEVYMTS